MRCGSSKDSAFKAMECDLPVELGEIVARDGFVFADLSLSQ